ncbi:MAG: site-specific integrase, partial [Sulfuritalea sp.]|nr:site-specific integrase [Sulfuritalea sp.]
YMYLLDKWQLEVGKLIQRIYAATTDKHWLVEENKMKQARTLNDKELNLLLLYINTRKHAARDRAIVLMTYWGGMRIGEVAATKLKDVIAADGSIKHEINLTAEQTKGKYSRTVVLADKLRKEIQTYLQTRFDTKQLIALTYSEHINKPLFATQKSEGFSANTLTYTMTMLYKAAGISGASSHSGRRSFLTHLSSKSVPLKVLMELAGHRQAQTTMRYINVTSDMKRAAVELV